MELNKCLKRPIYCDCNNYSKLPVGIFCNKEEGKEYYINKGNGCLMLKFDNEEHYVYWQLPGRERIRTIKEIKKICMNKFHIRPPY